MSAYIVRRIITDWFETDNPVSCAWTKLDHWPVPACYLHLPVSCAFGHSSSSALIVLSISINILSFYWPELNAAFSLKPQLLPSPQVLTTTFQKVLIAHCLCLSRSLAYFFSCVTINHISSFFWDLSSLRIETVLYSSLTQTYLFI